MISKSLLGKVSFRLSRTNGPSYSIRYWSPVQKNSTFAIRNCPRYSGTRSWLGVTGGVGLGLSAYAFSSPILCESITPSSRPTSSAVIAKKKGTGDPENIDTLPPAPTSTVNLYQLSFGTIAGICAGVFVKKGAKALAFFVGGIFVLLQYFNSLSLIKIDWRSAATKLEKLFYTTDINGVKRFPSISSLWRWTIDFLTADFQPRVSFIAGFALGLRIA